MSSKKEEAAKAALVASGNGEFAWLVQFLPLIAYLIIGGLITSILVVGGFAVLFLSVLYSAEADLQATQGQAVCTQVSTSTTGISSEVPVVYQPIFIEAAQANGISPNLLATIFRLENGTLDREPPPPYGNGKPWPVSYANAHGPFQFLPGTWKAFGKDLNGDGRADINDVKEAAYGSAAYLAHVGGKTGAPLGTLDNPNQRPSIVHAIVAYHDGDGTNFHGKAGTNYYRTGLPFYVSLESGSSGPQIAQTTNCTTTQPEAMAKCYQPQAVYGYGSGIMSGWSATALEQKLAVQRISWQSATRAPLSLTDGATLIRAGPTTIGQANAIIVELASGEGSDNPEADIEAVNAAIRSGNTLGTIYWITATGDHPDVAARNAYLAELAEKGTIKLIDWANSSASLGSSVASSDPAGYIPSLEGQTLLGDMVYQQISADYPPQRIPGCTADTGVQFVNADMPFIGSGAAPSAVAARAVQIALNQRGIPYVLGGIGNGSFDCSGLMWYAYKHAGVNIPRTANYQYNATTHLPHDKSILLPGDLIVTNPGNHARGPWGHIGMYIGDDKLVAADRPGTNVRIDTFDEFVTGTWEASRVVVTPTA